MMPLIPVRCEGFTEFFLQKDIGIFYAGNYFSSDKIGKLLLQRGIENEAFLK
jgi:hypothetical protein